VIEMERRGLAPDRAELAREIDAANAALAVSPPVIVIARRTHWLDQFRAAARRMMERVWCMKIHTRPHASRRLRRPAKTLAFR
jgi:hypothetical protein